MRINSPGTDQEDAIPASDDMLAAEAELERALIDDIRKSNCRTRDNGRSQRGLR